MTGDITMAETTADIAPKTAGDTSDQASGVDPATTFSPSGAPHQVVPDVDPDHPAVDNDPRKNTTADMNRIDFNDPTKTGAVIAAEQIEAALKKTKS
jgi:hypothetical protein